jgi:glycerol-3-phosphate O-acyltransferase
MTKASTAGGRLRKSATPLKQASQANHSPERAKHVSDVRRTGVNDLSIQADIFDILPSGMLDDITQAVLAREDVGRYLRGGHGQSELEARERIHAYLDELRTTQRYPIYRALKHPLYPILRKIERIDENVRIAQDATRRGRVIYISNHKSHLDYLVEPLVIDDNGIRPPVIAAGINLFGGPLGLIHRHVTGAIPIRRNAKDPAYLVTLKAYVAELLQRHDLLFYIEGGRSYTGELKSPKTGLLHAAVQAERSDSCIVPLAVSYDLVLEDHILAHQGAKRRQRPFAREVAEMVRFAVGYQSRAFVTLGTPIPLDGYDPESRRDVMALAHQIRDAIGRLYKVLPTAVVAAAMRPSITRRELESRADELIETLRAAGANMGVEDGRHAVEEGAPLLEARNIIFVERGGRFRVRERTVLRYYARTLQHLLVGPRRTPRTH